MPMALLRFLGTCAFPLCLADPDDIERVFLLLGAGLIEAELPPRIIESPRCVYFGGAVIQRMTPAGLTLARRCGTGR